VVVEGHIDGDCVLWGWGGVVNSPCPLLMGGAVMDRVLQPLGGNGSFMGFVLCIWGGLHCCFGVPSSCMVCTWWMWGSDNHWLCPLPHFVQVGLAAWQSVGICP